MHSLETLAKLNSDEEKTLEEIRARHEKIKTEWFGKFGIKYP